MLDPEDISALRFALQGRSDSRRESHDVPPRLLLVDDEPHLLRSLSLLLESIEGERVLVDSGREACRLLAESDFDIVLLDLALPDIDGHRVMDFINEQQIDTHVIVLSGNVDIDAAIGAIKRGAFGYLRKPYNRDELLRTVGNAIEQRRLAAENRRITWELECSEKLYRYLVDSSPDVIYTLNGAGEFTFINERGCRLLGYPADELIGKHYTKLIHEADIERARYVFTERRVGDRASRDVELRLKTGRADEADLNFEHTLISFNSTAIYAQGDGETQNSYFGTYGVARDVTARKRAEEQISHQTYHDILTNLPNRTLLRDSIGLAIIQARHNRRQLAILLIDLDRFKVLNDSLGHAKGDELLQETARRLDKCLTRSDTLARLSSDEFVILLPDVESLDEVARIGENALKAIAEPYQLDGLGSNFYLSASIGISLFPDNGGSVDELIRHADNAMYHVKMNGKNGMVFYDDTMEDAAQHKLALESSLRRAIAQGELEMYYQPQIDIRSGRIIGAEGLMRWNHPVRGLLGAGEFLPFAEEIGLILPISDWMLDALCEDVKHWAALGGADVRLSLNVSPQYLERGDFTEKIERAMQTHGVASSQIEVEITENICIRNPHDAIAQLKRLSQAGLSIAIDDFGTGYSSLSYLHRFPVTTLKIDQSFVREISSEDGYFPVILAIISVAHGLGLHLIAEGIETETQANYLHKSGCHTMQGYRFYRPMPHAQFLDLLRAGKAQPLAVAA